MPRRFRLLSLLVLSTLLACSARVDAQHRSSRAAPAPRASKDRGEPRAEFRAAWVATVDNIDFPSRPGLPVPALRAELDAIVRRAVELRLNALVFQVRSVADAFYPSPLEPWSEWLTGTQGEAPAGGFDPLRYLIRRCHQNGLQLHAWFNPFRCRHPKCRSAPHENHVSVRAPQLVVDYGRYQWMDPGHPTAQKWTLAVIQDVVRRYDIDGVHIDDYFYPYPEKARPFPDDASYRRYREQGGRLARDDWRRHNIDAFVQRMYQLVHAEKPWLMVGISPFGIARPGVPRGIEAGLDQYAQLYADVPKWLRNGWCDYLAPQLYWPIDQPEQSFRKLLDYWHSQNVKQRAIWPGLNISGMRAGTKRFRTTELRDQIWLIRARDQQHPGAVLFSFQALRGDHALTSRQLRQEVYRQPARVPRLPWLAERPRR